MDKKVKAKSGVSAGTAMAVGASVAALSAAAYVLFGPEGKKNRKAIRSWTVKMKSEIIEQFEKAKDITEPVYHEIVDKAQAKYAKLKDVDQEELAAAIADIKKHWKTMMKDSKGKAKSKKK